MAYTFYIACCGCTGATARFVVDQTRKWYCEWMCLHNKRHIGKNYMAFKKCYYLNGALLNQQKLVLPEP